MPREPRRRRGRAWARFRHAPPSGSALHRCGCCRGDYVVPVWFEDLGEEHGWHLLLRCGQCETYREIVVADEAANAYERDLERGVAQLRKALAELDAERMAAQVAALITALRLDLIDAGDFAARA